LTWQIILLRSLSNRARLRVTRRPAVDVPSQASGPQTVDREEFHAMATRALIDEFLSHNKVALLRQSSSSPVHGARLDEKLPSRGYEVSVVYLAEGATPRLNDVKDQVEWAIIAVPKKHCETAVKEAIEAQIPRLWILNGSETDEAVALCEANKVPVVDGVCLMLYAEPLEWICAFDRWLRRIFGTLEK
jgi:predicted CoA-binding protein